MLSEAIRSKIKRIRIQTKRMMSSTLTGDYSSAFKGSGLDFDQLREYQPGDDIRRIDWNSSAKMNKLLVKQFIQERDRTVILAIDISASGRFSSYEELRSDQLNLLGAMLGFIAQHERDNVGLLLFSDIVEVWLPPKRGSAQINKIIETIFSHRPQSRGTSLVTALKFLINLKKRNAIVFMLSDWIDEGQSFKNVLRIANIEYDFVAIRLLDTVEEQFPDVGFIEMIDPESGQSVLIDTRGNAVNKVLQQHRAIQKKMFEQLRVDVLDVTVGQSFVNPLLTFFHKRIKRQV